MGEYNYDHDSGNITYHYGDGFATDDAGKQYLEVGDGYMVDLEANDVHYAPSKYNPSPDYSNNISLWAYVGVGSLLFCIIYIFMCVDTDPKYFLHAVATGVLAYYSFLQAKK